MQVAQHLADESAARQVALPFIRACNSRNWARCCHKERNLSSGHRPELPENQDGESDTTAICPDRRLAAPSQACWFQISETQISPAL
ncbi:hypothetical protein D0T11_10800 [Hymenobacter rubripertinctus]|uniref:Uncharacterized protein n=1 Tax=Hymenobacter rubripertinctus TaxID=2029981 RepID=A0A418QXY0_9BACT|nr:hypothetical protein D0T11_10800 [Hymenobacter rubripertinctus]